MAAVGLPPARQKFELHDIAQIRAIGLSAGLQRCQCQQDGDEQLREV